jgi:iron complex transport system substrate-binding protein
VAAALTLGLAPAGAAATPIVVTDDAGRTVVLPDRPGRVVSLAPSNTEMLYALGLGDRLVAVNEWSDYPPEARTKVQLRGIRPSLEHLLSLRPDLVLAVPGVGEAPSELGPYGIPVLVLAPRDLEGVYRNIELLGAVLRVPDSARALTRALRGRVAAVRARVAGARRPRVFYEVDGVDPVRPFTAGPGTFVHELLELAGAENVAAAARGAWPQLSLEQLLKMDPEIVLLGDTLGVNHPQTPEMVLRRPGWERLTAIRRRAVRTVDGTLVTRPGPRIAGGLEAMARAVHPNLFGDPRPATRDPGQSVGGAGR